MKLLLENWRKYITEDYEPVTTLRIFDFDETLAFIPSAQVKIFFGYYLGKGSFVPIKGTDFEKAVDLIISAGVQPVKYGKNSVGEYLVVDFHGYEFFRQYITKKWRKEVLEPEFESRENMWGHDRYLSINYEFADPRETEISDYEALPAMDILKEMSSTSANCYVLTARGSEQDRHIISKVLQYYNIRLPIGNVIAWGSAEKGDAVYQLIEKHQPTTAYFYDDGPRNIEHVKHVCCGKTPNTTLHLIKYQRGAGAEIGEIDFTEKCLPSGGIQESTRIGLSPKEKRDLNRSRHACSRLRKLSGLF